MSLFVGTDAAAYGRMAQELAGRPLAAWCMLTLSDAGNTAPFWDHPPGYIWTLGLAYRLFGASAGVAVTLARITASLTALGVGRVAWRVGGWHAATGALIGLTLLPSFLFESQNCMLEGPLCLGLALSCLGLVELAARPRWGAWVFAVGFNIALLCKGVPAFVALVWLGCMPSVTQAAASRGARTRALGLAVSLAAILWGGFELWRLALGQAAFLPLYLGRQVWPAMRGAAASDVTSPLFYVRPLWRWFSPAIVLALASLWPGWGLGRARPSRCLFALGWLWVATVLIGFGIAAKKNQWYIHACSPGFALLAAAAALHLGALAPAWARRALPYGLGGTLLAYGAVAAFLPRLLVAPRPQLQAVATLPPPLAAATPLRVANCSHLSRWRTRHLFAFYWQARAVACDDPTATHKFDGSSLLPLPTQRAPSAPAG